MNGPIKIETCSIFLGQHAGTQRLAVVGKDSAFWGHFIPGDERGIRSLATALVRKTDGAVTVEQLTEAALGART